MARRGLLVAAISVALLASACGGSTVVSEATERPGFALVAVDDGLTLVTAAGHSEMQAFAAPDGRSRSATAVPVRPGLAAVVFADQIALVTADGVQRSADCAGCVGVATYDDRIVTVRQSFKLNLEFGIVEFNLDLVEQRTATAQRAVERFSFDALHDDSQPPDIVAASNDHIWVSYLSRRGIVRGGPDLIARYTWDGHLLDYVPIDGRASNVSLSSDRRLVAMSGWGSGGACFTYMTLNVIDLQEMRRLNTMPKIPRQAELANTDNTYYQVDDVYWRDGQVVTEGGIYTSSEGDCAPAPRWRRTFDPESKTFADTEVETGSRLRPIGPSCGDGVEHSPPPARPPHVIVNRAGRTADLGEGSIVLATSGDLTC